MITIRMLNIILIIVLAILMILALIAVYIIFKIKSNNEAAKKEKIQVPNSNNKTIDPTTWVTRKGDGINSIYQFMEFDSIVDNMIVRHKGQQYVMVLECKGINYDLLSEEEKESVEAGFIEVLNTLRFPIQLYIQTRSLNLKALTDKYIKRTDEIKDQINRLDIQIQEARRRNDDQTVQKLTMERNRKANIYEYGQSIEEYTMKISGNRNILQQKTYVVISYYVAEYGDVSKYSKEELRDIAFSELYTRTETLSRALMAAEVTSRILSSEELAELLYVAYNKDESETYSLEDALNAEYDRLYSTARDVLQERKDRINKQIEADAQKVATKSIFKADEVLREERIKKVKEKAKEMVDDAKDELSVPLYEETKKQIDNADVDAMTGKSAKRVIRGASS